MKTLWLMIALAGAASVSAAAAPVPAPNPLLQCHDEDAERGTCAILWLGAPATPVDGTNLALIQVDDNRCPVNVNCVWAGYVTTTLVVENRDAGVRKQKITLSLDPREQLPSVWVDDASGLTVILEDVSRLGKGPQLIARPRQAKVRVGYNLAPNPNI